MPRSRCVPAYDEAEENRKALAVVERYFDVDITDADSAYDVLVDNGVHAGYASAFAQDMYPPAQEGEEGLCE